MVVVCVQYLPIFFWVHWHLLLSVPLDHSNSDYQLNLYSHGGTSVITMCCVDNMYMWL